VAVVLLAFAGTAAAVSVEFSEPAPVQVGDQVEYNVAVQEPFRDAPSEWTLQATTGLGNATWTLQVSAQGDPVDTVDAAGANVSYDLTESTSPTPTLVNVSVSGDVPRIGTYSYDEPASERVELVTISRVTDGNANALETIEVRRYTEASQNARTAIDDAIEAVGGQNDKIEQAISAYNTGNFENAQSLAEEAQGGAQSSQLLIYAAIAVVVLAVVGGGIYYWRKQRDTGYKLQ
jgi:hypothetical protein